MLDKDVLGLDVSMAHPLAVHVLQCQESLVKYDFDLIERKRLGFILILKISVGILRPKYIWEILYWAQQGNDMFL